MDRAREAARLDQQLSKANQRSRSEPMPARAKALLLRRQLANQGNDSSKKQEVHPMFVEDGHAFLQQQRQQEQRALEMLQPGGASPQQRPGSGAPQRPNSSS